MTTETRTELAAISAECFSRYRSAEVRTVRITEEVQFGQESYMVSYNLETDPKGCDTLYATDLTKISTYLQAITDHVYESGLSKFALPENIEYHMTRRCNASRTTPGFAAETWSALTVFSSPKSTE